MLLLEKVVIGKAIAITVREGSDDEKVEDKREKECEILPKLDIVGEKCD